MKELTKVSRQEEELIQETRVLKQDAKRLMETIDRNAQTFAEKLRQRDEVVIRLERREAEMIEEASLMKNELKLAENLLKGRLE